MRYDFRCHVCGRIEEASQHDAVMFCRHEGQGIPSEENDDSDMVVMKRVFSNIGISFKGSGFYKNDISVKKPR